MTWNIGCVPLPEWKHWGVVRFPSSKADCREDIWTSSFLSWTSAWSNPSMFSWRQVPNASLSRIGWGICQQKKEHGFIFKGVGLNTGHRLWNWFHPVICNKVGKMKRIVIAQFWSFDIFSQSQENKMEVKEGNPDWKKVNNIKMSAAFNEGSVSGICRWMHNMQCKYFGEQRLRQSIKGFDICCTGDIDQASGHESYR